MREFRSEELFDLCHSIAGGRLGTLSYPWQILDGLGELIMELAQGLDKSEYEELGEGILVSKSARIAPTVSLSGPCIIGHRSEVRHCAYLRGCVLVGEDCVVGNSTELKNCILFDRVQVPHYNYVGDSILGFGAHLGAGVITANLRTDRAGVSVRIGNEKIDTGRRKLGALIGDGAEIGCGSVLNPGTVVGKNAVVHPLTSVRGIVSAGSVLK